MSIEEELKKLEGTTVTSVEVTPEGWVVIDAEDDEKKMMAAIFWNGAKVKVVSK